MDAPLRGLMDYRGEDLHTQDLSTGLPDVISRVDSLVAIRPNIVHNTFEALLDDWGMTFALVATALRRVRHSRPSSKGMRKRAALGGIRTDCLGEFTQLFLLRCMSPQMGSALVS
jgi:hypothetical protein